MKFISSALLALAFCTNALFASYYPDGDCCDNGFDGRTYLGASIGVSTQTAKHRFDTQGTFLGNFGFETLFDHNSVHNYSIRPWGELFAGWGRQCACFYWGARLGVNFSGNQRENLRFEDLTPTLDGDAFLADTLREKHCAAEFTFDFKPGWVFCSRNMVFGIIGGAVNRHELKGTSQLTNLPAISPPGQTLFSTVNVSRRKTSVGLRTGLGFEYMICGCWSLQMTYVYTWYQKLHASKSVLTSQSYPHIARFSVAEKGKQVASIGLSYYF